MDFIELTTDLFEKMQELRKAKPQKNINDALHGEAFVLHYISHHHENVLPGEISDEMNVSSARIAAVLNKLESKGLITRQIDPDDRRRILVGITQKGKESAEKHQQYVIECFAQIFSRLGEQDAREYVRITGKLAKIMAEQQEFN